MSVAGPITPEPRRFSLRLPRPLWIGVATVVIVILAVGTWFGIPVYHQQVAIREIEVSGSWVEVTRGGPDFLRRWIGDEWMKVFDIPKTVVIRGRGVAAAEQVKVLKSVTALSFWSTQISDERLSCLESLSRLELLDLRDTAITGAGLVHLRKLQSLRRLDLSGTRVTDDGMQNLRNLSNLEFVGLASTRITDFGLDPLNGLANLRGIDLIDTNVTDAGIAELQRALPELRVNR